MRVDAEFTVQGWDSIVNKPNQRTSVLLDIASITIPRNRRLRFDKIVSHASVSTWSARHAIVVTGKSFDAPES